jgi:hypothetical protein
MSDLACAAESFAKLGREKFAERLGTEINKQISLCCRSGKKETTKREGAK